MTETIVSCNIRFIQSRREELLERSLEHFLDHGVADATLRPLAKHVGSSARLLVYHFGSKEELLAAVVEEAQSRLQAFFTEAFQNSSPQAGMSALRSFWEHAIRPKNLRLFRLLFEIQILAFQNPAQFAPLLGENSKSWLSLISEVLPPSKARRQRAILCAAVLDGLLLELLAGGNRRLTTAALDEFSHLLERGGIVVRKGSSPRVRSAHFPARSQRNRRP